MTGDSHTLGVHLCVAVSALDWGYRVELKRGHMTGSCHRLVSGTRGTRTQIHHLKPAFRMQNTLEPSELQVVVDIQQV